MDFDRFWDHRSESASNPLHKHIKYEEMRADFSLDFLHTFEFIIIILNVKTYQRMARGGEKCVIASTTETSEIQAEILSDSRVFGFALF